MAYLGQELIEHPELLRVAIVVHLEYLVHEEWLRRVGQDWTFFCQILTLENGTYHRAAATRRPQDISRGAGPISSASHKLGMEIGCMNGLNIECQ